MPCLRRRNALASRQTVLDSPLHAVASALKVINGKAGNGLKKPFPLMGPWTCCVGDAAWMMGRGVIITKGAC